MSDSSLSDALPSETILEHALRGAVQEIYRSGVLEELTVKRVRTAAEEDLELQDGFFKRDTWKERSKRIIELEAEAQSRIAPNSSAPGSRIPTPVKPVKQSAKDKKHESTQELGPSNHTRPTKRQRREVESDNISLPNNDKNAASDDEEEPLSIGTPRSPLSKALEEKPSAIDGEKSTLPKREEKKDANSAGAEDESDLSSPLDDEPRTKAKARNRRSGSVEKKVNTKAKSKAKDTKRKASDTNPDGDEIKRLQGWLIKCGIRKMWYKELAPYDSPKAKIRHLKDMLNDAGMTGRYSVERATQIRDARELKSELEAVQAGAKQWGKANSDDETEVKPKKRLARGLTELDFLNESDGAETD